ncbi:MAG: ABC transporter permease, partial [Treponema sp.]|nr:ABC transporter permease [Treponema sp.]
FLGIITMLWQFLTPIMYETPEKYRHLFNLNPMTAIIECYKQILYYKHIPHVSSLWAATLIGVGSVVVGELIFSKLQKGFAEEL